MNRLQLIPKSCPGIFIFIFSLLILPAQRAFSQEKQPTLHYSVSMPDPSNHSFHITLDCSGLPEQIINFKLPKWMPGYYQIMNYGDFIGEVSAKDKAGNELVIKKTSGNSWQLRVAKNRAFTLTYDVKAEKRFVANSFLDSSHAYLVPAATFFYIDGRLNSPVYVEVNPGPWKQIATGLENVKGKPWNFFAADVDILYDCPLLIGNLQQLPSFYVKGKEHRFIGYKMGLFDEQLLMNNLEKMVKAASNIFGDIPYKQYTFIGIGPGRGGIEHLNNTTVSFDGKALNSAAGMHTMMSFLAHEYFHHYNVKRVRPFELGPFDYQKENRTNSLWISEGLSVYYEYIVLKRAGLINEETLLQDMERNINALENNPGRFHQSLVQASYDTWSDGPFGKQGADSNRSISYYEKGPIVGMFLDFAIRNATQNRRSLDDVFTFLYLEYYKKQHRGFTEAEFQQVCESVSGMSMASFFEYIYTTQELDYHNYLEYAGLSISETTTAKGKKQFTIKRKANISPAQSALLEGWLGN
ncbi:MAG: hypothetical protein JWQ27_348 [Ferruginibacter sp.]|nr:hypothetical protein [Ferruginibacter sp.]